MLFNWSDFTLQNKVATVPNFDTLLISTHADPNNPAVQVPLTEAHFNAVYKMPLLQKVITPAIRIFWQQRMLKVSSANLGYTTISDYNDWLPSLVAL